MDSLLHCKGFAFASKSRNEMNPTDARYPPAVTAVLAGYRSDTNDGANVPVGTPAYW